MWTITQHGFTSVVAYDARKDMNKKSAHRKIAPNPGTHLLVRARVEEDLFPLKAVCPNLVIETDPKADYSYRAVISRSLFKEYLALEVDQITYGAHFKEQFAQNAHNGQSRYRQLMDFWTGHASWQRFAPYSGFDRWAKPSKKGKKTLGSTSGSSHQSNGEWGKDLAQDITGQTSMFNYEDTNPWGEYDHAEETGALQGHPVVTVETLKELVTTDGYDTLSLSVLANMDKDALALAERLDEIDDPDSLSREDLDDMALLVVWENSTDAEKEIWVDSGADFPRSSEVMEEVDTITNRLANKG